MTQSVSEPTPARRRAWYLLLLGAVPLLAWGAAGLRQGPSPSSGARASSGPPARAPATTTTGAPSPEELCADALAWVESAGLALPSGTGYHCPSTQFGHHGAACWYAAGCPRGRFIAVNVDLMGQVTPDYVRYVVAHEICHIVQFDAGQASTEADADACAAGYGATG